MINSPNAHYVDFFYENEHSSFTAHENAHNTLKYVENTITDEVYCQLFEESVDLETCFPAFQTDSFELNAAEKQSIRNHLKIYSKV